MLNSADGERTILYVEDHPANAALVEQILARRKDLRLIIARDGHSGVAAAIESVPDVILMDINIPGINGIEALILLRNDPRTAHIPILAVSANAAVRDVERALKAGFLSYITKPIRIKDLFAALDAALAQGRRW